MKTLGSAKPGTPGEKKPAQKPKTRKTRAAAGK